VQPEGGGGRRKYAEDCRPKRHRPGAPLPAEQQAGGPPVEHTMRDRTRAELERLGLVDTIDGAMLLQLADRMDRTTDGSPYAALSRQYSTKLDQLRDQHAARGSGGDRVDVLARRRAERQAAAGA